MSDRSDTFYSGDNTKAGYGAQWFVGDGASPEGFEAVAFVKRIKPGSTKTADVDRTHLRSPDRHKEHAPGMRDTGPFEIEGWYAPSEDSHSVAGGGSGSFQNGGLPAIAAAATILNHQIVLNDGSPATTISLRGYVAEFSVGEIQEDGQIPFMASVQPTEAYDLP